MSVHPEYGETQDSCLGRRDPRWRLAAFALAILGAALLRQPGPAAAAVGFAVGLTAVVHIPGRWYRLRMGALLLTLLPFLIVVPFAVDSGNRLWEWRFLHLTDAGLWAGLALAMKTVALVTLALTLLASAPLHVTLHAAGRLGVPRLVVQITLLTYRYTFVLLDELNRLRVAVRVRGFRNTMSGHAYRTVGQVAGTLLVRGADRAERVAHAMRCRGFDGSFRTTTVVRTTFADVLMFNVIVGTAAALVAWDFLG